MGEGNSVADARHAFAVSGNAMLAATLGNRLLDSQLVNLRIAPRAALFAELQASPFGAIKKQ